MSEYIRTQVPQRVWWALQLAGAGFTIGWDGRFTSWLGGWLLGCGWAGLTMSLAAPSPQENR